MYEVKNSIEWNASTGSEHVQKLEECLAAKGTRRQYERTIEKHAEGRENDKSSTASVEAEKKIQKAIRTNHKTCCAVKATQ